MRRVFLVYPSDLCDLFQDTKNTTNHEGHEGSVEVVGELHKF
jgi:hypothetical protein